jgi:hypothetical protein
MSEKDLEHLSEKETQRRLDAALKRSLQMKPKPHKPKSKKAPAEAKASKPSP